MMQEVAATRTPEEAAAVFRELHAPAERGAVLDADAPDWWMGDDEAYESSMGAARMVGAGR